MAVSDDWVPVGSPPPPSASDWVPVGPNPSQAAAMTHTTSSLQMDPNLMNPAVMGGGTLQIGPLDTHIPIGQGGMRRLATIGSKFADMGQGIQQLFGGANQQDVLAKRELDKPLMNTPEAPLAGAIGTAAMAAPLTMLPGGQSILGAAAYGGAFGGLQPHASNAEWARNAGYSAAGAALGQALGQGAQSLSNSAEEAGPLTMGQQQAKAIGDELGFKLPPGKASGNVAQQQIDAWLESHPQTSGPFNAMNASNQKTLNSIAADAIGVKSNELSSPVLAAAESKIGDVFDTARALPSVPVNPDVAMNGLAKIEQNTLGTFKSPETALADQPLVRQYLNFATKGDATGDQLVTLRSNLGTAAKGQMGPTGDHAMGRALFDVQDLVDQHLTAGSPPELSAALTDARGNYRNLMSLTSRNNVVNPSSGNVSAKALASALSSKDKGGFVFGKNDSDFYNAARFSQAFPDVVGNSGTATREAPDMTLAGIASQLGGALGSRLYMSPVGQAITKGTTIPAVMLAKGLARLPPGAVPAAGAALGLANSPK